MDQPNQTPDPDRLQQLDEDIDHARRTAQDADLMEDPDEPKYYESGSKSDIDDQTALP